jgi:hypothetical protein
MRTPQETLMFWTRSGFQALSIGDWIASLPAPLGATAPATSVQGVRDAMLRTLGEGGSARKPGLARRIRLATSAEALWDLRTELMQVCAQCEGEASARRSLAGVDAEFRGLLPASVTAKRRTAPRH